MRKKYYSKYLKPSLLKNAYFIHINCYFAYTIFVSTSRCYYLAFIRNIERLKLQITVASQRLPVRLPVYIVRTLTKVQIGPNACVISYVCELLAIVGSRGACGCD